MTEEPKDRPSLKEYFQMNELFTYFFRKKNNGPKPDFTIRSMHFINKFSIVVFLLGILYLIIKNLI